MIEKNTLYLAEVLETMLKDIPDIHTPIELEYNEIKYQSELLLKLFKIYVSKNDVESIKRLYTLYCNALQIDKANYEELYWKHKGMDQENEPLSKTNESPVEILRKKVHDEHFLKCHERSFEQQKKV